VVTTKFEISIWKVSQKRERKKDTIDRQTITDQRLKHETNGTSSPSATYLTMMFAQTLSRLIHSSTVLMFHVNTHSWSQVFVCLERDLQGCSMPFISLRMRNWICISYVMNFSEVGPTPAEPCNWYLSYILHQPILLGFANRHLHLHFHKTVQQSHRWHCMVLYLLISTRL
jgi:hypothetical protein